MKGVEVSRILDVWCSEFNCDWSPGEVRSGDRELEYLISDQEKSKTKVKSYNNQDYFVLSPKTDKLHQELATNYSSLNAEQYNNDEIKQLILNKPTTEFL